MDLSWYRCPICTVNWVHFKIWLIIPNSSSKSIGTAQDVWKRFATGMKHSQSRSRHRIQNYVRSVYKTQFSSLIRSAAAPAYAPARASSSPPETAVYSTDCPNHSSLQTEAAAFQICPEVWLWPVSPKGSFQNTALLLFGDSFSWVVK